MTDSPNSDDRPAELDRRYLDVTLDADDRTEILLAQMSLAEKAGLFFQAMITIGPNGTLADGDPAFAIPSTTEYLIGRQMSHFNVLGNTPSPDVMAEWHNRLQDLARTNRFGIPVTLSTDPRHSASDNPGTAVRTGWFSQWPEPLGFAAIGDEALVETFGNIARQEYLAVGLRVALHPQIDLTTEPRWARQIATFGEDAELTARLAVAYIRGFQGAELDAQSVATMTKHFPGGGPQKDGEDPHFAYGREQIYPGGNFEYHLKPFEAAFAAGTSQIMPYYGMPIGTEYEEVGFGFNRSIITGLLRDRFGFDGVVCTDWGLLTDANIYGDLFPARAWGVEHLSPRERLIKAIQAGVDQFGGEACPELLVHAVEAGEITLERVDQSARRLLREKFRLGLFDQADLDPSFALTIVGNDDFRALGQAAQSAAITVLSTGQKGLSLPLAAKVRIYAEGVDQSAGLDAVFVATPEQAEVAVIRLSAPFEERATRFENNFHAGSLEFMPAVIDHVAQISEKVPTIVVVFLDRPAILTPLIPLAATLLGDFGANDGAVLDVLFGKQEPRGRLPFDLPRSEAAVVASAADVPFDTANPLFTFGHGLSFDRPDP
ncbi:glycoside hydrolase family 3 protein [Microbacterium pumilum]|uniref:beta-glucosidase n=1 Tax=Microbacterium pumilum TaxID=344165 RepID=A0ABP5EHP0_9MICO